ncbi:Ankyrin repeat domain containing protein [Balamuthia mandrillaris]
MEPTIATAEDIPVELLCLVFSFLPLEFIAIAARTCRRWWCCACPSLRLLLSPKAFVHSPALLLWAEEEQQRQHRQRRQGSTSFALRTVDTVRLAASGGHLSTLRWLLQSDHHPQTRPAWDQSVVDAAAKNGHVEVLRWFMEEKRCRRFTVSTWIAAAAGGHLHVLRWLLQGWVENDGSNNFLRIVRQDRKACKEAARGGHLETLQWLRGEDVGCRSWNEAKMCRLAARSGNLKLLQWLREEEGCSWDELTCAAAAEGGHLHVLRWLREDGRLCPWDERTCAAAAQGGHLDVLRWLHESACPWDHTTCTTAAVYHHSAPSSPVPLPPPQRSPHSCSSCHSYNSRHGGRISWQELALWARENGCVWDQRRMYRMAILDGALKVLQRLHAERYPVLDHHLLKPSVRGGHLEVLQWAKSQLEEHIWKEYVEREDLCALASKEGRHEVLQWLQQQHEQQQKQLLLL